mmetsp:Transcript_64924/g.205093  ORF Transcript_64924/g.205093 Transcript_64924/m.205093 type:complete len:253 (-) Transcript_64924:870-1628(-)
MAAHLGGALLLLGAHGQHPHGHVPPPGGNFLHQEPRVGCAHRLDLELHDLPPPHPVQEQASHLRELVPPPRARREHRLVHLQTRDVPAHQCLDLHGCGVALGDDVVPQEVVHVGHYAVHLAELGAQRALQVGAGRQGALDGEPPIDSEVARLFDGPKAVPDRSGAAEHPHRRLAAAVLPATPVFHGIGKPLEANDPALESIDAMLEALHQLALRPCLGPQAKISRPPHAPWRCPRGREHLAPGGRQQREVVP